METINDTRTRLEAFISETYPDADIAPGSVLSELLTKLAAVLQNNLANEISALSQTQYIQTALASATDTFNEIIGSIASNYNVVRNQGSFVTGLVKVSVTTKKVYFIPKGFTFQQPNLLFTYATTVDWQAVSLATGVSLQANQVALQFDGSNYFFILPVQATTVGQEAIGGNVNNTQVTNLTQFALGGTSKLPEFIEAVAYGNFSSGQNVETDKQLISRFQQGLANKSVTSPKSLESVLKTNFPVLKTISVVGANDAELQRNRDNIFGISTFGLADVYVRTSDSIETLNLTLSATQVSESIWQMTIPAITVPGFYRIVSISPSTGNFSGTYPITNITYSMEFNLANRNNSISDPIYARFTKYQNAVVTFMVVDSFGANTTTTTTTSTTTGAQATMLFNVQFSYMPLLEDIQDFIISDDNRVACADYLVRAVIPCEVSMNLTLYRNSPLDNVPVSSIKQDIFTYINNLGFGEDLVISKIVDICHNYDIKRVDLPISVTGSILIPGVGVETVMPLVGSDVLTIPTLVNQGISPKTTLFFINYLDSDGTTDNIGITLI